MQEKKDITQQVNQININVQRLQREAGKSFVSRTTLKRTDQADMVVFRSVIMNPMTNIDIICEILDEQEEIYNSQFKI